jgi:hypothetical protein
VTVLGEDGRQWRVSPGLLSPMKDVPPLSTSANKLAGKKKRLR